MTYRNDLGAAYTRIEMLESELERLQSALDQKIEEKDQLQIALERRPPTSSEEKKWMKVSLVTVTIMFALGIWIGTLLSCENHQEPQTEEQPPPDPSRPVIQFDSPMDLRTGDSDRAVFDLQERAIVRIDAYGFMNSESCSGRIRLRSSTSQNNYVGMGEGTIFQELAAGHYSIGVSSVDGCGSSPGAVTLTLRRYEHVREL